MANVEDGRVEMDDEEIFTCVADSGPIQNLGHYINGDISVNEEIAEDGSFEDGYDISQLELQWEKKDREKERNEFLAREQRAHEKIKDLEEEIVRKDKAIAAIEATLSMKNATVVEMQQEQNEAAKEAEDRRLQETQALQQEVEELREKLRGANDSSRSNIQKKVEDLTTVNHACHEEVIRKVAEVEKMLRSEHKEECRNLKDRHKELDDKHKEQVKKLTEDREELEGILRRTIEASPNESLRRALESATNHENWERQKKRFQDKIQQLKNNLKDSKRSQNAMMKEKVEDLRQETEVILKDQLAKEDGFDRKEKFYLQELDQSKARIRALQRSLEAANTSCQQLTEEVSDVKTELEEKTGEAKSRAKTVERQHEQLKKELQDQIVYLKKQLDAAETDKARLNEKIHFDVTKAKDQIIELSDQHHREIMTLNDNIRVLQSETERCKRDLEASNKECNERERNQLDMEEKIKNLMDELDEKGANIKRLNQNISAMETSFKSTPEKRHGGGLRCSMRKDNKHSSSMDDTALMMQGTD